MNPLASLTHVDRMDTATWSNIVSALADKEDVDTCVAAAARLHKDATSEDIPALLELLRRGDFFEREAAAWPLAELSGPAHLQELFDAYQRGFDEGHDNDGFTAALLEIPARYPDDARAALTALVGEAGEPTRGHAAWLLEFCESAN